MVALALGACMGRPSACFCRAIHLCLLWRAIHPAWPQHSRQLNPGVLLPELCKGKKQWDFSSYTDWLQGLLGQPDVHQYDAEQAKIKQTGSQWLEMCWFALGIWRHISLSLGKRSWFKALRNPVLCAPGIEQHLLDVCVCPAILCNPPFHSLLQISYQGLCWQQTEIPE